MTFHCWRAQAGRSYMAMEHVDADSEMEIVVDLDRPLYDSIEPCDGKGFYCPPTIRLGLLEVPGLDGKPVTYARGADGEMHRMRS